MRQTANLLAMAALAAALAACASTPPPAPPEPPPAPAPVPPPPPPPPAPRPTGPQTLEQFRQNFQQVVGVDRVFFDLDEYAIRADQRQTLDRQGAWLRTYPSVSIRIAGHADERGTREYNLALGARRANAVKDYLVSLGVDAGRIETVSFGKEQPADPRSNEEAWSLNRRAETQILGPQS